jgi:hypothetical protein
MLVAALIVPFTSRVYWGALQATPIDEKFPFSELVVFVKRVLILAVPFTSRVYWGFGFRIPTLFAFLLIYTVLSSISVEAVVRIW